LSIVICFFVQFIVTYLKLKMTIRDKKNNKTKQMNYIQCE
jgi:hypothetical protein